MTALQIERNGADPLADAPRFKLLSERDVLALDDLEWLVDGLIPMHGSALLYGPAGIGATPRQPWRARPRPTGRGKLHAFF